MNRSRILIVLLFIPYLWLMPYNHPMADDFDYAHSGKTMKLPQAVKHHLEHTNSRYTASLILTESPLRFGNFTVYRLCPLFWIMLLVCCFFFFFRSIGLKPSHRVAAFLFVLLWLNGAPSLPEGFYWLAGSATYQSGHITALSSITLMIILYDKEKISPAYLALCSALLVACFGTNECVIGIVLSISAVLTIHHRIQKKYFNRNLMVLLTIQLALLALILSLPGNWVRAARFEGNFRPGYSLLYTALQSGRFGLQFLLNPSLWCITFLGLGWLEQLQKVPSFIKTHPLIPLGAIVMVMFCCFFPPYFATGILGQHRTANTAFFFFIPLWLWFSATFRYRLVRNHRLKSSSGPDYAKWLWPITFVILLGTGNALTAIVDLASGRAASYDQCLEERECALRQAGAKQSASVVVEQVRAKPASLFVVDIDTGCTHWINKAYALYYGVGSCCGTPSKTKEPAE